MIEVREPLEVYGKKKLTVDEYLEFERTSTEKHEYFRGEVFAMSGVNGVRTSAVPWVRRYCIPRSKENG
jgi:hypothetical protein